MAGVPSPPRGAHGTPESWLEVDCSLVFAMPLQLYFRTDCIPLWATAPPFRTRRLSHAEYERQRWEFATAMQAGLRASPYKTPASAE